MNEILSTVLPLGLAPQVSSAAKQLCRGHRRNAARCGCGYCRLDFLCNIEAFFSQERDVWPRIFGRPR